MLRRALPLVLAALVIAPALAQDRIVSPTMQRNARLGARRRRPTFPSASTGSTRSPKTSA